MSLLVHHVPLGDDVDAWFTGRDRSRGELPVGVAGNLSHHRPHRPDDLAHDRAAAGAAMGLPFERIHLMRQVHGNAVAQVDADTPVGAELRGVDALVTAEPDRPLGVGVADCVPVLLAGDGAVAAVHAGRRGVEADVLGATLAALEELGVDPEQVRAAIGPAIGGCCYEVPEDVRAAVSDRYPAAAATTTWGTPSLDLRTAVHRQLRSAGAVVTHDLHACTRCDPDGRWFSHRADPGTGRQLGVVVRRGRPRDAA